MRARGDKAAALRFFEKAMKANGVPEKAALDQSGTNQAAVDEINGRGETLTIVRQMKYLNNIVQQDHRAIKRITRPMLNFKSFVLTVAAYNLTRMRTSGQIRLQAQ